MLIIKINWEFVNLLGLVIYLIDDVANKSVSAHIERKARRTPHTLNIM